MKNDLFNIAVNAEHLIAALVGIVVGWFLKIWHSKQVTAVVDKVLPSAPVPATPVA